MLNEVQLIGRIITDIEIKKDEAKGLCYLPFILAIPVYMGKGKLNSKPVIVMCICYDKLATLLASSSRKGQRICVKGKLGNYHFYTSDNRLMQGLQVRVERIYFLEKNETAALVDRDGNVSDDVYELRNDAEGDLNEAPSDYLRAYKKTTSTEE